MSDFSSFDLVGIADGIRQGKFSSREVTAWSLARLDTLGRQFNAVFRIDHERALERADSLDTQRARGDSCGALHGVPLAHKDMFDVAGLECHAGSLILKGRVPERSAFIIEQMDRAGQVNLGSLHMSEFAMSPTGFNQHYGSGKNPWNPDHISGGSSSGSGIVVAGRMVFGSIGGDTGGSIRLPAAMCGVTGIKTTFRRVSTQGALPLSFSLDCLGPLAQSARDCARLLRCIGQANPQDSLSEPLPDEDVEAQLDGNVRGLRIGVLQGFYREDLDAEMASCLDAGLDLLRRCGVSIATARLPDMMAGVNALSQMVLSVEAATLHRKWVQSRPQDYSDQVRGRIEQGFAYSAVRYAEALSMRGKILSEYMDAAFANCDVLYAPVMPLVTPRISETLEGASEDVQRMIGRVGQLARGLNYLGLPAISVPAGLSRTGLPMAFQLIGRPFSEATLLKIADAYQRQSDWHRVSPFDRP